MMYFMCMWHTHIWSYWESYFSDNEYDRNGIFSRAKVIQFSNSVLLVIVLCLVKQCSARLDIFIS